MGGSRVGSALQLDPHKDSIWGDVPPSQARGEAHAGQPFGKAESHSAPSQLSRPCGLTHLRTGQRPTAEVEGCLPRPGTQAPGGARVGAGAGGAGPLHPPPPGKAGCLARVGGGVAPVLRLAGAPGAALMQAPRRPPYRGRASRPRTARSLQGQAVPAGTPGAARCRPALTQPQALSPGSSPLSPKHLGAPKVRGGPAEPCARSPWVRPSVTTPS